MSRRSFDPRILAVTAVMTAIVFVLTRMVQVPTPAKGYIHLGDAGIFFSALAFGPWVGSWVGQAKGGRARGVLFSPSFWAPWSSPLAIWPQAAFYQASAQPSVSCR
jgi:uncharacterized membrane protein